MRCASRKGVLICAALRTSAETDRMPSIFPGRARGQRVSSIGLVSIEFPRRLKCVLVEFSHRRVSLRHRSVSYVLGRVNHHHMYAITRPAAQAPELASWLPPSPPPAFVPLPPA